MKFHGNLPWGKLCFLKVLWENVASTVSGQRCFNEFMSRQLAMSWPTPLMSTTLIHVIRATHMSDARQHQKSDAYHFDPSLPTHLNPQSQRKPANPVQAIQHKPTRARCVIVIIEQFRSKKMPAPHRKSNPGPCQDTTHYDRLSDQRWNQRHRPITTGRMKSA